MTSVYIPRDGNDEGVCTESAHGCKYEKNDVSDESLRTVVRTVVRTVYRVVVSSIPSDSKQFKRILQSRIKQQ